MSDKQKQTWIDDGTEFDGSIRSRSGISVSGKIKGQLHAPTLTVTQTGIVQGRVKVENLKSEGEISGDIEAKKVELAGKVSDSTVIQAESLEVKLNQPNKALQVTFGNCELRVGDPASRKDSSAGEHQKKKEQPKGQPVL